LENLKAGKYLLIALKDLNNNNKFDRRKDWVYQTFYHHSHDTVYELELFKETLPFKANRHPEIVC
jgi:uncharacterized protein (DUF2141 family)